MKIIKYKKGTKGLYKVELEDGRILSLYEDVILKFELLLKKEIFEEHVAVVYLCKFVMYIFGGSGICCQQLK